MKIIKKDIWKWGVHNVGYTLYKLESNSFGVSYHYPNYCINDIRIYKSLTQANRYISKHKKLYEKRCEA